jgi:hypothetical protein
MFFSLDTTWGGFLFFLFYLGPSTLSPGLGLSTLCSVSFSSMYLYTDHWLQFVRRKLPLTHWFSSEIHVKGIDALSILCVQNVCKICNLCNILVNLRIKTVFIIYNVTRLQCHDVKNIVKLSILDPINILNSRSKRDKEKTNKSTCFFSAPKFLKSQRIDSKEWIPQANVAWRAGTTTLFLLVS